MLPHVFIEYLHSPEATPMAINDVPHGHQVCEDRRAQQDQQDGICVGHIFDEDDHMRSKKDAH